MNGKLEFMREIEARAVLIVQGEKYVTIIVSRL
jgi:hypothetical protein